MTAGECRQTGTAIRGFAKIDRGVHASVPDDQVPTVPAHRDITGKRLPRAPRTDEADAEPAEPTPRLPAMTTDAAPAQRLSELLRYAGAPTSATAMMKEVGQTWRVCRLWMRKGPSSMATTLLTTGFNEWVHLDIVS